MRIALRYLTTFTYDTDVSESHNALRACPADNAHQRTLRYAVEVDPATRVVSHRDYWGTRVDSFGVVGKHTRLTIVADAEVETTAPPSAADGGAWVDSRYPHEHHEYLSPTPHATSTEVIADFATDAVAGTVTLTDAALAIQAAVGERLSYAPGTTVVGTSAAEVFDHRRGVCQDEQFRPRAVPVSAGPKRIPQRPCFQ